MCLITKLNCTTGCLTKLLTLTGVERKQSPVLWYVSHTKHNSVSVYICIKHALTLPPPPSTIYGNDSPQSLYRERLYPCTRGKDKVRLCYFIAHTSSDDTELHAVRRLMHLWKSCRAYTQKRADVCLGDNYRSSHLL